MNNKLPIYLKDIKIAIIGIEKFIEGLDFEQFKSDDKTSSAVIRKFEINGEATKNIPDVIRKQYPQIPWKDVTGMRDKFVMIVQLVLVEIREITEYKSNITIFYYFLTGKLLLTLFF